MRMNHIQGTKAPSEADALKASSSSCLGALVVNQSVTS